MTLLPEVERALVDSVRRDHQARARRPIAGSVRAWLRARPRRLLLVAAAIVVSGSTAAAITLSGQRSAPLSSIVPPGQQPNTALAAGTRYDIEIAPSVQAGQISWCSSIRTYERSGRPEDLGTGTCDTGAPTSGSPIFGASDLGGFGGGLAYLFTSQQVAAVRIAGGPTVLTRSDPRLPYRYRAAVFEYKPPSASGHDLGIPEGASQLVTPLDSSGRPIGDGASGPPVEPTRSWLYPAPAVPGSCSLTAKPGHALYTGSGTVVTGLIPAPDIAGQAFLPCIDTDLYLAAVPATAQRGLLDGSMQASLLLNAKQPGAPPAMLPDMRAVPGQPDLFDRPDARLPTAGVDSPGMTAERRGDAWLVVIGGSGTNARIRAIHDLTVGPVDNGAPVQTSLRADSLCTIRYTPAAGLQETSQVAITSPRDTRQAYYNTGQRIANIAYARLARDLVRVPNDHARIAADQAALALTQQALSRRIQLDTLFPPTCATATFYYQQRWPISATIALATKDCPGPRVPVPCDQLRPSWRHTIVRTINSVTGDPSEFVVPANLVHRLETVKQIGKWWLVVAGGANHAQQQLLLDHLIPNVAATLRTELRSAVVTPLAYCAQRNPTNC